MTTKKIFSEYLGMEFSVTEEARKVITTVKVALTEDLYYKMFRSLLGFNDEMQLAMAVNLRDAVNYAWERYTGIEHVDEILKSFYLAIDKELDRIY
jgi:hypothetical protein